MNQEHLQSIAKLMVAPGKGILAIDESLGTSEKRFKQVGVEHTKEKRRNYRQLLVTAPGIEQYVSGYILFDETLRQKTDEGISFVEVLEMKGILPGIKVDQGMKEFPGIEEEKVTSGLEGLPERLQEYKELGAKFAKWRAAIEVSDTKPSQAAVEANADHLAKYALACQEAGLVPMVEPEILIDGNHSIDRCEEVSGMVWETVFKKLKEAGVYLPGIILKTSMVISGKDAPNRAGREEVAERTVKALKKHVPSDVAGIVFLSGGQGDEEATEHLNLMNQLPIEKPWPLSFSYGRSIQRPALAIWANDMMAVEEAQKALVHRAQANSLATKGEYTPAFEEARGY